MMSSRYLRVICLDITCRGIFHSAGISAPSSSFYASKRDAKRNEASHFSKGFELPDGSISNGLLVSKVDYHSGAESVLISQLPVNHRAVGEKQRECRSREDTSHK